MPLTGVGVAGELADNQQRGADVRGGEFVPQDAELQSLAAIMAAVWSVSSVAAPTKTSKPGS
jgi:hypothetical protein